MKLRLTAVGVCLALASCAQPPSEITPISMPNGAYQQMSCRELATEKRSVSEALKANSVKQRQAVAGDAFGVFMIGVPMSSLTSGDKKADIAVDKGKLIQIDDTMQAKHCASVSADVAGS